MQININHNNVGTQHFTGPPPSFIGWEQLIEVEWHTEDRRWTVRARATEMDSWSVWMGSEDELDQLLSVARDVATGG
jgi:hypothetical protein